MTPGSYRVQLVVVDNKGDAATVTHTVDVRAVGPSDPFYSLPGAGLPVASAGTDFAVAEGQQVRLLGTGSPLDQVVGYTWRQTAGTPVTLDEPNAAATSFMAPAVAAGRSETLTFELKVSNGLAQSLASVVNVQVLSQDKAPVAKAGPAQTVASGAQVTLDGSASADPEGKDLGFAWVQLAGPDVDLTGSQTSKAAFTAPAATEALELQFELRVTDGRLDAVDRIVVSVRPVEAAPGFQFTLGSLAQPGLVAFAGGDEESVWDFGDGTTAAGADPVHAYSASGTYTVTLTMDGRLYQQQVTVTAADAAPVASAKGTPAVALGAVLAALAAVGVALRRR